MGYTEFYNFVIPLYGLSLGMSAGAIGMLVGARSLLAVFLSIHVGARANRWVTPRVRGQMPGGPGVRAGMTITGGIGECLEKPPPCRSRQLRVD